MTDHSYSRRRQEECMLCPGLDGKPGQCDHTRYRRDYVRFMRVPAHAEAFMSAYLDGNSQAAANELERLAREFRTLPSRHACSCWPTHCRECQRLDAQRPRGPDIAVSIGRTTPVHPPAPMVSVVDVRAGYA